LSSCCPPVDAAEYNFNVNEWDCIFLELGTLFNQALKKAGDALHVKIGSNDYSKIPASGDEIKIRPPGSRKFVLVTVCSSIDAILLLPGMPMLQVSSPPELMIPPSL
jgi:hypothetical protein